MNSDTIVAKRYAKALFELARDHGIADQVGKQLQAIDLQLRGNADLRKLLNHPGMTAEVKLTVLRDAYGDQVAEMVYNTIQLMIDRGRGTLVSALASYYEIIADEALGQAKAIVYAPTALEENEASEIAAQFGRVTGKRIQVIPVIEPSLLGGLRVQIGGRLYDGSLASKLTQMEKSLTQAQAL